MKYAIALLILISLCISGTSNAQDCSECRGDDTASEALESHANRQLRVWSKELALSSKQIKDVWALMEAGHAEILKVQQSESDTEKRIQKVATKRTQLHKKVLRLLTSSQKKRFANLRPPHDITRNHRHKANRSKGQKTKKVQDEQVYTERGLERRLSAVIKKWSREVPLSSSDISKYWTVLEEANVEILKAQEAISDIGKRQTEIKVIRAKVHQKMLAGLSEDQKKKYLERAYFF